MLDTLTPAGLLSPIAVDYLAETRLREAPLLGLLSDSVTMQKQDNIDWGAKVGYSTIGGRAVTDALSDDTVGQIVPASMTIPQYYVKHQFSVVKAQLINALTTGRISAVRNEVKTEIEDALTSFMRKIQTILYTATGVMDTANNGVFGLESIIGSTGNYANISRTTFNRWNSIVDYGTVKGTPENLTIDKFTKHLRQRRVAGASYKAIGGSRLVIVTTDEIQVDVLRKLFFAAVTDYTTTDNVKINILPFSEYTIKNIPVISDVDCPANTMYFINPSKLGLYGFDDSDTNINNPRITYFPLSTDNVDTTLMIRLADVTDPHPDFYRFEISTRFQLVAFDPLDTISAMKDISNTIS